MCNVCRRKDIGRNKVDAAHDTLEASHNLCTTIDVLHMDVVLHWQSIVELARESTVGMYLPTYMVICTHFPIIRHQTHIFLSKNMFLQTFFQSLITLTWASILILPCCHCAVNCICLMLPALHMHRHALLSFTLENPPIAGIGCNDCIW